MPAELAAGTDLTDGNRAVGNTERRVLAPVDIRVNTDPAEEGTVVSISSIEHSSSRSASRSASNLAAAGNVPKERPPREERDVFLELDSWQ